MRRVAPADEELAAVVPNAHMTFCVVLALPRSYFNGSVIMGVGNDTYCYGANGLWLYPRSLRNSEVRIRCFSRRRYVQSLEMSTKLWLGEDSKWPSV